MDADTVPEPTLVVDTLNDLLAEPALDLLNDTLPDIAPLALAPPDQADVPDVPDTV